MRLPAETPWLLDPPVVAVCSAIEAGGFEVYFVGGCVRDALLGRLGSDVDMSTNARPEDVMRLAKSAGLKPVPTGIDHGTVTVVSEGKGFEITTFRQDVETDGRRAVVSFSDNIVEDARRRDFTMNALYARPDGTVVDPLNGLSDLRTRRIRFIDDAAARIREDYLRILRFFRFHAWFADPCDGFDPETLDAIARNSAGLETLSAERVGVEMIKLLTAPDPAPVIAAMRSIGVLSLLLPGCDDRLLGPVVYLADHLGEVPDPLLRLAALGGDDVERRLRLSKKQLARLELYRSLGFAAMPLAEIAYRHGCEVSIGVAILRASVSKKTVSNKAKEALIRASQASFPITARDLMPEFEGKALGQKLAELEARWIASDFTLTRDELLG